MTYKPVSEQIRAPLVEYEVFMKCPECGVKVLDECEDDVSYGGPLIALGTEWFMEMAEKVLELEKALYQEGHVIIFTDNGWSIQHPIECRPDMTECLVHRACERAYGDQQYRYRGKYRIEIDEDGFILLDLKKD